MKGAFVFYGSSSVGDFRSEAELGWWFVMVKHHRENR